MTEAWAILELLGRALAPVPRPQSLRALRAAIDAEALPWEHVVEQANALLVTPALWSGLQGKALAAKLPEDLQRYLAELHRLNAERNRGLAAQTRRTVRVLNDAGIEPIALKGAAHHFRSAFADDGVRIMTDIDLLVPTDALPEAVAALAEVGYAPEPEALVKLAGHHHYAPLLRLGEPASVELHAHVVVERCQHLLPTAAAWAESEPVAEEGLRLRVLSPTFRVLHALVHSELSDLNHLKGRVNLRQLHDVAATATRLRHEVDWPRLRRAMVSRGQHRAFAGALALLAALLDFDAGNGLTTRWLGSIHRWRCRQRLVSERFQRCDHKLQNFSGYSLERRFGLPPGALPLTRARARYLGRLLARSLAYSRAA